MKPDYSYAMRQLISFYTSRKNREAAIRKDTRAAFVFIDKAMIPEKKYRPANRRPPKLYRHFKSYTPFNQQNAA